MRVKLLIKSVFLILFISMSTDAQITNWTSYFTGTSTYDIVVDNNLNIWVGTKSMGLWNITTNEIFRSDNSDFPDYRVNALYLDDGGNIWCGTQDNGLVKFNRTSIENYRVAEVKDTRYDRIRSLIKDKNGIVWCGAYNLYSFDGTSFTKYDLSNSVVGTIGDNFNQLLNGNDGNIRLASKEFYTLNDQNTWEALYPIAGSVSAAAFDSKGNYWIGYWGNHDTDAGLSYYDNGTLTNYTPIDSPLPSNKITTLAIDKYDQLWIGTFDSGVALFNGHSCL